MNSSIPPKLLIWPIIQPYLDFLKPHQDDIDMVIKLKDKGKLSISAAEETMTKAIIEIHDVVAKILHENSIIKSDSEISKNKMEIMVREVLKL
jgi:hypothetical protein